MTETREQFLARVADAHYEWEGKHLPNAVYDPDARPDSGDANLWYLDMSEDAALQQELAETVGEASYAGAEGVAEESSPPSTT